MNHFGEQLHRVLCDTFDFEALEKVVVFRLHERLDRIAPSRQNFDTVVFRVVLWADQHGRTLELVSALVAARPHRAELTDLHDRMAAALRPAPAPFSPTGAELPDALAAFIRGFARLRRVMPPSTQRTVLLEEMVTKIRAVALAPFNLPDRFHLSASEGERLAAAVALRQAPSARYVRWLAERLAVEDSFAGYHAAVALAEAARSLPPQDLDEVADAVADAIRWLDATPGSHSGRRGVLMQAAAHLAARTVSPPAPKE